MPRKLAEALPELVLDIEGALVRIGRGAVADQVRASSLEAWTYDDFSETTYLELQAGTRLEDVGETISLHDEIGVNLDLDARGRVIGMAVVGYEEFLARLTDASATTDLGGK
jgi:uncharacterized protein YuzE